ncbi:hypothetical protein BJY00DRAFT_175367 [Aspergillus carlsbadensis]|nr:hypothetical protein BJY00DRAFT_175367 [Aspergillus carlsbadensis]
MRQVFARGGQSRDRSNVAVLPIMPGNISSLHVWAGQALFARSSIFPRRQVLNRCQCSDSAPSGVGLRWASPTFRKIPSQPSRCKIQAPYLHRTSKECHTIRTGDVSNRALVSERTIQPNLCCRQASWALDKTQLPLASLLAKPLARSRHDRHVAGGVWTLESLD